MNSTTFTPSGVKGHLLTNTTKLCDFFLPPKLTSILENPLLNPQADPPPSVATVEARINPLNKQEGGGHYKDLPIQPIEYCMANKLDQCQSNIIKYVTRFRHKGGLEDLKKAQHYLDILRYLEYGEEKSDSEGVGGS